MLGNLKAAFKLILLVFWIGLWFIFLVLAFKLKKMKLRDNVMQWSSAGILRIIGIRVTMTAAPAQIRPLLLASNHISYLDILILNASAPVHFTPKIEISGWPIAKHIAHMSGSVYVDRRADQILAAKEKLMSALAAGNIICLFPEATTGDGLHMLPFKSGFFSLAAEKIDGRDLTVQPVALNYSYIRRLPIDRTQWPSIAWYGNMELLPHLWNLLKIAPIEAELAFLAPVTLHECGDRKKLTIHCQSAIHDAIQAMRSRPRHCKPKTANFHPRFLRIKK